MAEPDAKGVPEPPPNLRVASFEDRECGNCQHYQRGRCELPAPHDSHLPVDSEWICDSWKAGGSDTDDGPAETPAKNLAGAEKNALIRVREHNRRRRAAT